MPTAAGLSLKRPIQCVLNGNLASMGSVFSASLPAGGAVRSTASVQVEAGRTPPLPPLPPLPPGMVPATPSAPPPFAPPLLPAVPPAPPLVGELLPPLVVLAPAVAPPLLMLACPPLAVGVGPEPAELPQP